MRTKFLVLTLGVALTFTNATVPVFANAETVYSAPTVPEVTYKNLSPLPPMPPTPVTQPVTPSPSPPPLKPAPKPKAVVPDPIFPKSMVVINAGERTAVSVKQSPDSKSKTIGHIYGGLTGIKVIKEEMTYSLIEIKNYATNKIIKGYVSSKLLKTVYPRQDWGIMVDLSKQTLYIYKDGKLLKSYLVSTGLANKGWGTPAGTYILGGRGKSFSLPNGVGAWNWVRFNNNYLFHSVIFNKSKKVIKSEAKKLGQQASHGCIRMPLEESKWFYSNIPGNTPVLIVEKVVDKETEPVINLKIDGIMQTSPQPPVGINGRVFVPLRSVVEALGAQVNWQPSTQTATVTKENIVIVFKINEIAAVANGFEVKLDQPPQIINGITMVPVRFLVEALGAGVEWDNATSTVNILT